MERSAGSRAYILVDWARPNLDLTVCASSCETWDQRCLQYVENTTHNKHVFHARLDALGGREGAGGLGVRRGWEHRGHLKLNFLLFKFKDIRLKTDMKMAYTSLSAGDLPRRSLNVGAFHSIGSRPFAVGSIVISPPRSRAWIVTYVP